MNAQPARYNPKIRRLLEDRDLNGLVSVLRDPTDPDLRLQAAQALGELEDLDATESLVRSTIEDPDAAVQAAARQALDQLLGNRVDLVIRSYRSGPAEEDPWLVEPVSEETGLEDEENDAGSIDLEGLLRVATHESNPGLRLKAIRLLALSSDMRATDMLAYLVLRGDSKELRETARLALEERFGDKAASLLQGYREIERAASGDEDGEDLDEYDEDETEEDDIEDEEDLDQDFAEEVGDAEDKVLAGDRVLAGGKVFMDGEEEDEETGDPRLSDFPRVTTSYDRSRSQVIQEEGVPWMAILLVVLIIAIVVIVLLLTGIL